MAQLQSTGVTGSLVVTGTITAQEFHTEFVSSSILHESGSTVFGNSSDDTHIFTGTLSTNGQLDLQGALNLEQPLGDNTFITLNNKNTAADVGNQKSFIDFKFIDSNTNETPQVRIGAHVGNNDGDASSQEEEGMGAFVVYTNNADTDAGEAGASLAERFRVDRLGNVGIGTTNPAYKLDVRASDGNVGQVFVKGGKTTVTAVGEINSELLFGSNDSSVGQGRIGGKISSVTETSNGAYTGMAFYTYRQSSPLLTEKMRITNDGNVGIGTPSPSTKLYVDNGESTFNRGNSAGTIATFRGLNASKAVIGTAISYFTSNVGIGTTDPQASLQIGSNVGTSSEKLDVRGNSSGNYVASFEQDHVTGYGVLIDTDGTLVSEPALKIKNTSGNILYVGSNGNVGIGTTSPLGALQVKAGGLVIDTGNDFVASSPVSRIFATDGQAGGVRPAQGSHLVLQTRSTASRDIIFATGTTPTERLTIRGAGNVGIGTSDPSEKLEVAGKGLFTGTELKVENASDPSIQVSDTDANYKGAMRWLSSDNVLEFYTRYGGTYYTSNLVLDRGNVGIGTTSPEANLQIASTYDGMTNGINTNQLKLSYDASVNGAGSSIAFGVSAIDKFTGAKIVHERTASNSVGDLTFWTRSTAGTSTDYDLTVERMRIDSDGNVGIGTTSPGAKLEVTTSGFNSTIITDNSDEQYSLIQHNALGAVKGFTGYNSGFMVYGGEAGVTTRLQAGGAYAATILTNGNVGIGTTSPGARLQVGPGTTNQQSQVASIGTSVDGLTSALSLVNQEGDSSDGNGVSLDFHNADNWSATGRISVIQPTAATGVSTNSSMQFSTYGTVGSTTTFEPRMTIDYRGNVGIGTNSPSEKLEVAGNLRGNNIYLNDSTVPSLYMERGDGLPQPVIRLVKSNDNLLIGHTAIDEVIFYDDAGEAMRLDGSGNLGIGATSPGAKLDVVGPSNGDVILRLQRDGVANYDFFISDAGDGAAQMFQRANTTDTGFIFQTKNSSATSINALTIAPSGNVGIGTTSPNAKLQVEGGIKMADDTDAASANKVGTMRYRTGTEYVEADGVELITNGDFEDGATDWSFGTGWAPSNGGATVSTAGITNDIRQSISYVSNISATTKFRYRFEITDITAGSLRLFVNKPAFTQIANVNAVGVYEYVVEVSVGSNGIFYLYSTSSSGSTFQGTVTNVSVVEVTEEDASYADMCMQTGASTYEWVNIIRNTY